MDVLSDVTTPEGKPSKITLKSLSALFYRGAPAFAAALVITAVIPLLRTKAMAPPDISIQYLEASVLRLMMSDELAIDGELERAGDKLENALAGVSSRELENRAVRELVDSATKIRDHIAASDRKSAVDSLLIFRKKSDEVSAAMYRPPGEIRASRVDYLAATGGLVALVFMATVLYRRRRTAEKISGESAARDVELVRREFSVERERTTGLQQKLVEAGKLMRTKDAGLDDAARLLASLAASEKSQAALIQSLELKRAEADAEAFTRISEFGVLNRKVATAEAESRELTKSHALVIGQLDSALSQLREVTSLARSRENSLSLEISGLRTEGLRVKSETSSETAVLEWSNIKFKGQITELEDEVNRLKAELITEARRFRDQLAKIYG